LADSLTDSAMLHPLKRSENYPSKMAKAKSLKARKRLLMLISPI